MKKIGSKLVDIFLGKPEAHRPGILMNRKQKRERQRVLRKRAAAKNRLKYERRKS